MHKFISLKMHTVSPEVVDQFDENANLIAHFGS